MLPADWRLPIVILAAITDGVDGQLSRLMHAESKLGVLLDPIADKVFFLAVVATLVWDGSITWLEVILVSLRDLIVVLGGIGAWLRDGGGAWHQMKPRWPGKLVTVLQFAFIAVVLLEPAWSDVSAWRMPILVATAIVGGLVGDRLCVGVCAGCEARHESAKPLSELRRRRACVMKLAWRLRASYSTPFVDGIPVPRGSISTACRSARAVALKIPSMMWCVLRPWWQTTCRFISAVAGDRAPELLGQRSVERAQQSRAARSAFQTQNARPLRSTAAVTSVSSIGTVMAP